MSFSEKDTISSEENIFHEPQPDYEKAALDQLRDAIKRTYKERLLMANRLYKIQQMFNRAIIIHKPYTPDK